MQQKISTEHCVPSDLIDADSKMVFWFCDTTPSHSQCAKVGMLFTTASHALATVQANMKEIITKAIITCYEIYRLYFDAAKGDRTRHTQFSNHRLPC